VNAISFKGLSSTEVLLDNQAHISNMRQKLLHMIKPISDCLKVNGVGGIQLELSELGYLDEFIEVYASQ
jgi:hypothetical protein